MPPRLRRNATRRPSGEMPNDRGTPRVNRRVRACCRGKLIAGTGARPPSGGPGAPYSFLVVAAVVPPGGCAGAPGRGRARGGEGGPQRGLFRFYRTEAPRAHCAARCTCAGRAAEMRRGAAAGRQDGRTAVLRGARGAAGARQGSPDARGSGCAGIVGTHD
ncbi:hypothetical protein GCM10027440_33810 [Nocardiopsis coralliicola]